MELVTIHDFNKLNICVGTIIAVHDFPEAKKPAYKLTIDFGPTIGIKKSSAQITENYTKTDLLNTQVLCVVNFPPRQIGPFLSEVLTLGIPSDNNTVILIRPDKNVPLGGKLY
jgi:tRNA-binding protein